VRPAHAQVEVAAVVEAAQKVYQSYKTMMAILQSDNPTPEDQILAQLASIEGTMQAIDSQLQQLDQAVALLVYEEKRANYLEMLRDVQRYQALALTASQEIGEWTQTGKTDPLKLANADNNSQLAANTLMQPSFYMRPADVPTAPDIFEYRTTVLPYLYALTVRLGVVALEQPRFRQFSAYTDEFHNHAAWLQRIPVLMGTDISCQSAELHQAGQYAIYSYCQDTLSGNVSGYKPYPSPGNPFVTMWTVGSGADADNAFGYYTFYDHWWIQEWMGEHTVENILPYVEQAAILSSAPTTVLPNVESGPLLTADGKCLDLTPLSFTTATCNPASSTQLWTTVLQPFSVGPQVTLVSATKPSSVPDACLETFEWQNPVFAQRCSGSSGEQWILSSANEIRWGRNSAVCLQNDMSLHPCNGAANQKWYRNWPSNVCLSCPKK
jgi:hypothetical protein